MAWTKESREKANETRRRKDAEKRAAKTAAAASAAGDAEPTAGVVKEPKSMAPEIGLLVNSINEALTALPWTRRDALNQREAEILVDGLDKAQMGNKTARRWIGTGTRSTGLAALAIALVAIALPRLARHGLLPGTHALTEAEELAGQSWQAANAGRPPTREEWTNLLAVSELRLREMREGFYAPGPEIRVNGAMAQQVA